MNIKILDSWLKEYVKTNATPQQIAGKLSLTSVSVEKLEKINNDYLYDIEVTTNRPDLMSIIGLARETAAVLQQNNIHATFSTPELKIKNENKEKLLSIQTDPKLTNRVLAVVMEVTVKDSPNEIKNRLEATDIRSLNNVIDITNYVMRVTGHPTHVMDFDRLKTQKLIIRESKKDEKIQTLDKKNYTLSGGDIVATNSKNEIVDLLGVMGVENSVVTNNTKRILFFVNNNEPTHIRKTSMLLGIRTEAAVLNEKAIDPELALVALRYGIELYEKLANGKVVSEIIDIYDNKIKAKTIKVQEEQINSLIGIKIPLKKSEEILRTLGFSVSSEGETLTVTPPSFRALDIEIPEDVIEEIARVYGYHNIPNELPPITTAQPYRLENNEFYWENHVKDMFKYWGFTEVYTYPMVSENLYEGPLDDAVTITNPLSEEFIYMRSTLIPSLLNVIRENKDHERVKIFEISNVYHKKNDDLPDEISRLAGIIKHPHASFYEAKGIIEQLFHDLGVIDFSFKPTDGGGDGAKVWIQKTLAGNIEILDDEIIDFELDFRLILQHATLKKIYKPVSKYPPIIEDLALLAPDTITVGEIMELIKIQSPLITEISLLDKYKDTRTFHIVYQSYEKNLTTEDVTPIREKILKALKEKLGANLKE